MPGTAPSSDDQKGGHAACSQTKTCSDFQGCSRPRGGPHPKIGADSPKEKKRGYEYTTVPYTLITATADVGDGRTRRCRARGSAKKGS